MNYSNFLVQYIPLNETLNIIGYKNEKLKKDIERIANKYNSPLKELIISFKKDKKELFDSAQYKLENFTIGYCIDNKVNIVSENYFIKKKLNKIYGDYYKLLLHECIHAVLNALNPKCSMDIIEGICVYESGQLDDFRKGNSRTYIKNAILIENIIKENGYKKLIDIIKGKINL